MESGQKFPRSLQSGGEMGELTRNFDWSSSSIGPIEYWPQSLKTTLGILLHSSFPMFLFWGPDLTCFYNDAYRPSLGINGKHPAVGRKGNELWTEIWNFIGPVINKVITSAQASFFENQLLPIYRNGKMEDVYWTFSYSPAYNDGGEVYGVFVTCTETTGAVKALQEIQESEYRFRTMSESIDILIAVTDEHGNATYFNTAWTALTGVPLKDLLRQSWMDLLHEEDRKGFLEVFGSSLENKQSFTGEFRIKNKDQNYSWLLVKSSPRYKGSGNFAGHISTSIDITDRKKAEQSFAESEQKLRALVDSAPFPIGVYLGREMKITLANEAIIEVWGKGNEVIGKRFGEILPELNNQEVLVQLDNVFITGVPFHTRHQYIHLEVDGKHKPYYFNYSLTPLFDESGAVYGVVNTGADVTDLNIAKQKIEQSERNFRAMILQAPVAMCILRGPTYIIEIANALMIELWGKEVEDVMHRPVFEALPDATEQGLEQMLNDVYNNGQTASANERPVMLVRNGEAETVYLNFVYEPYFDADGTIVGILAIATDVTNQVIARNNIQEIVAERTRELAEVNNNLQRSNEELAQFAYIASHDLQEPVRKISTYVQMLEQRLGTLDELPKKYIDKIADAASRMRTLISDVLNYSELSRELTVFETVDLGNIIDHTKNDFELLMEQKGATVYYENLPAIEAIPLQMLQLFGNLVSNALKFSRTDVKPVIKILATVMAENELEKYPLLNKNNLYYNIEFSDNGIGFKPEHAEQIFNIFQRLHGRTEYAGTGIGLSMCKKIAQNHHGEIYATSNPGSGAIINVILPARQPR